MIKDRFPLLEKILAYFKTEGEVNSILAGYIAKVFSALADKYKLKLWKYLQTYKENLDALLKKSGEQSVVNMLTKLMENCYGDSTDTNFIAQKQIFIKALIEEIDETNVEGKCSIIMFLLHNNVEVPYFLTEEIVTLLYQLADKYPVSGLGLIKTLIESHNAEKTKGTNINESGKIKFEE